MQRSEEKEKDFKRIQDWLKKTYPNDWDKFDLQAEYDSTLKYAENKAIIRDKLKLVLKDHKELQKEQAMQAKADEEKYLMEQLKKAEEEVEEYNSRINYESNQEIDKYYEPIRRAVDKVCKGYSNLLFVRGSAGIGKSFSIRRSLIENKTDYLEIAGEVTEAYLYRLLFENNGKVIWLKDVANLLNGLKSINILKAATETEKARVITKNNYSRQQDDLPDRFVCRCRFIFDYNNIQNKMRDDFEALISRGDYLEFALSLKDIQNIMRQIAKTPEQKQVTEFLIKEFVGSGLVRLNLRTQWKAFNTYDYAVSQGLEWTEVLSSELKRVSKVRTMLYGLIGDEAVRSMELKKLLLRHELVPSMRVAHYKVKEWIFTEELYKVSPDDLNPYLCINNIKMEERNVTNQSFRD